MSDLIVNGQIVSSPKCLSCCATIDAFTHIEGEDVVPKEFDLSVCFYCGEIGTFTDTLDLRATTDKDDIPAPTLKLLRRVQGEIRARMK